MSHALTIMPGKSDRWFEGNDWYFAAQDAEGSVLVRIDDGDWSHLRALSDADAPDEPDNAALELLARMASAVRPILSGAKRRIDVLLR